MRYGGGTIREWSGWWSREGTFQGGVYVLVSPNNPRPNLLNEPSTVFSFSDNGGRSSDNASREWTVRTVIHGLCRVLITRWQLVN